jgi:hypothetical protein
MRQSTHGRTLLEMAVVRVASLERLEDLADVVESLRQGHSVADSLPKSGSAPISRSVAKVDSQSEKPTAEKKNRASKRKT